MIAKVDEQTHSNDRTHLAYIRLHFFIYFRMSTLYRLILPLPFLLFVSTSACFVDSLFFLAHFSDSSSDIHGLHATQ